LGWLRSSENTSSTAFVNKDIEAVRAGLAGSPRR
jgi:hypothetical protein